MGVLTFVGDAGPLLHLYWVGASGWAFPAEGILVVRTVAEEVIAHDANVLDDPRLAVVDDSRAVSAVASWNLDAGETAALSLAVEISPVRPAYFLCDELRARNAARVLGVPVIGSIGLILRAYRGGRVSRDEAETALLALPKTGRLHVHPALLEVSLRTLREGSNEH